MRSEMSAKFSGYLSIGSIFWITFLLSEFFLASAIPRLPLYNSKVYHDNGKHQLSKRAVIPSNVSSVDKAVLPPTISDELGNSPLAPKVYGQCRGAIADDGCSFNMRSHQILDLNGTSAKVIAMTECIDSADCEEECIKRNCNYFIRSDFQNGKFLSHLYKLEESVLDEQRYVTSSDFDSAMYVCKKVRSRRKRQMMSYDDYWCEYNYYYYWYYYDYPYSCLQLCAHIAGEIQGVNSVLANEVVQPPAQVTPTSPCGLAHFFSEFSINYKKSYSSEADMNHHSATFCDNVKRMDELNRGALTNKRPDDAICGINKFADEDTNRFVKTFTGAQKSNVAENPELTQEDAKRLRAGRPKGAADRMDWREFGVIPPIRYQGQCGACYAFTTSDIVSIQNAIRGPMDSNNRAITSKRKVQTLSAQYVMDCSPKDDALGCQGGRPLNVLNALIDNKRSGGIPLATCYKYKGQPSECRANSSCCEKSTIANARMLDLRGKYEKDAIAALLRLGPVIVVVNANEFWQFYNGTGILKSYQCSADFQNHAILLVGYDFTGATPYYIVRNSWNNDWGEDGYAKLEAGTNACSAAKTVITVCVRNCAHFTKDPKAILFKSIQ